MTRGIWFERFDVAEAYYLFFRDYHEGQWSEKYSRMCKLTESFKPSPILSYDNLEENGQAIYDSLVVSENKGDYRKVS